jgi:hypothetical protein
MSVSQATLGTGRVTFDWALLRDTARYLLGYGLQAPDEIAGATIVNPQQIYASLKWRTAMTDKIRPFFNDPAIIESLGLNPVVVEVSRRRGIPTDASTPRVTKPVLSLPRK